MEPKRCVSPLASMDRAGCELRSWASKPAKLHEHTLGEADSQHRRECLEAGNTPGYRKTCCLSADIADNQFSIIPMCRTPSRADRCLSLARKFKAEHGQHPSEQPDPSTMLYFLHIPRTAGRTYHSCFLKLVRLTKLSHKLL